MSIFLNDWAETGKDGILSDFAVSRKTLDSYEFLVASSMDSDTAFEAFILMRGKHNKNYFTICLQDTHWRNGNREWRPKQIDLKDLNSLLDETSQSKHRGLLVALSPYMLNCKGFEMIDDVSQS